MPRSNGKVFNRDVRISGNGRFIVNENVVVDANGNFINANIETIAAGGTSTALDLTKTIHDIDADAGGDIFTLADGTLGQEMICVMKSATGTATIAPSTLMGGTSVTFNAAGDTVTFVYTSNGWAITGGNSYAIV